VIFVYSEVSDKRIFGTN